MKLTVFEVAICIAGTELALNMQDVGLWPVASYSVEKLPFAHMLSISPVIQRYQN